MADENVTKKDSQVEHDAVDVFTHSSTAFPGAWTEEEFSTLLDTWQDVVERTRYATRRFNVAQRILKRYRRKGVETITIDVIRKQIKKLRTEYEVYKGLLKIGIKAYRAPCVDQLELILDKIPSNRRRLFPAERRNRSYSEGTGDGGQRQSNYDDADRSRSGSTFSPEPNELPSDQESVQKPRYRFQRTNGQRLITLMIDQQQAVMDKLEKLFKAFEASNSMMVNLIDTLLSQQKGKNVPQIVIEDKA